MTRIKRDKEHSSLETWLIRYSGRKLLKASCTKLPSVNFNITLRLSINLIYPTMTSFSTIIMQHIFFLCFDTTGNIPAKNFRGELNLKGSEFFYTKGKGCSDKLQHPKKQVDISTKKSLVYLDLFHCTSTVKEFPLPQREH